MINIFLKKLLKKKGKIEVYNINCEMATKFDSLNHFYMHNSIWSHRERESEIEREITKKRSKNGYCILFPRELNGVHL